VAVRSIAERIETFEGFKAFKALDDGEDFDGFVGGGQVRHVEDMEARVTCFVVVVRLGVWDDVAFSCYFCAFPVLNMSNT
jgi:hypothetical protein